MDDHAKRGLQSIGNLTSRIVSMQSSTDTTSSGSPNRATSSATDASAMNQPTPTGTQLGEPGCAMPSGLRKAMAAGDPAATDRELGASLPPSVSSACQAKWNDRIDSKYGFDSTFVGFVLKPVPPPEDLAVAAMIIRAACAPASPLLVKSELARLRATTVSRNTDQNDLALTFAAYAEALAEYPADIVTEACRYWSRHQKFWPALAELLERAESMYEHRKLLAEAVEHARCRSRMLRLIGQDGAA